MLQDWRGSVSCRLYGDRDIFVADVLVWMSVITQNISECVLFGEQSDVVNGSRKLTRQLYTLKYPCTASCVLCSEENIAL